MSGELGSVNGGSNAVHQKSYKRKYRKLRHQFKEVMRQSDELFKQEQLATLAIRRLNEENTRILDFLVDLNESSHLPKDRRHNIGSPSRPSPPRFLSPTMLAQLTGGDMSLLDPNGDVEEMELTYEASPAAAPAERNAESSDDDSSSDDDDDDDDEGGATTTRDEDDDEDDKEAYQEEIREWNFKRGIAGTPPRSVREKMKAEAEKERKEAEKAAEQAAEQAAAEARNGVDETKVKTEEGEEDKKEEGKEEGKGEEKKKLILEEYRRGHTPEYLKDPAPFLMTLEEEEDWYREIDTVHKHGIPPLPYPPSPGSKAESDPRNPMSVYCWLRKNQPQVFLQTDEDGGKKAGGRGRGGGRRKVLDMDSGDEASLGGSSRKVKPEESKKRRRAPEEGDSPTHPRAGGGRGGRPAGTGRGGRKKEGEPPLKRQKE